MTMQESDHEIPIDYGGSIGWPLKPSACPTTTYVLGSLENAIEISRALPWYWFRGHDRVFGELTPSVFRRHTVPRAWMPDHFTYAERNAYNQFRRKAPAHLDRPMLPNDAVSWLMLMQHHGCPTRLLDWSESLLVALFFAVRDRHRHNEDAELWAMFPPMLNELSAAERGLPPPHSPHLAFLAEEAWGDQSRLQRLSIAIRQTWCAKQGFWHEKPPGPIAFEPQLAFPRLVAQRGVFTIHPNPYVHVPRWEQKADGVVQSKGVRIGDRPPTIVDLLTDPRALVRYIVPAQSKPGISGDFATLGYSERTLFMSLDGLGAEVRQEIGGGSDEYKPRVPPLAGGPWPTRFHPHGWPGI